MTKEQANMISDICVRNAIEIEAGRHPLEPSYAIPGLNHHCVEQIRIAVLLDSAHLWKQIADALPCA